MTFDPPQCPATAKPPDLSRRGFVSRSLRLVLGTALLACWERITLPEALGAEARTLRVAAIVTEFTPRSHAHVLLENFLEPCLFNGRLTAPGMKVVSLYVDQFPDRDMARELARRYGISIHSSIAGALCLDGDTLAVEGVLIIGEHGQYPVNEKGQQEYPRKRFFDEVVAVFRQSNRVAPIFNDKHLSYRWDWAKEMYDTAVALKVPFLAGSSVPLAERRPPLEIPRDARITGAVSIHSGPIESYDFHGLEVLQSLVESRRGGETGVAEVRFLEGEALWEAARRGDWSIDLARAALATDLPVKDARAENLIRPPGPGETGKPFVHHGILVRYRDGLKAIVLAVGPGGGVKWQFACQVEAQPRPLATSFYVGPWQNRNLFKALAHAIQHHFREQRPPYPVERTLLTTGILAAAMDSRFEKGKRLGTPQLDVTYQPVDFRELRETGASWKVLTEDIPEPPGFDPLGSARGKLETATPDATRANERR